jgi:hypothetical protein
MGNESISSSRDVGSVSQHIEGVLAGKLLIGGGSDTSLVLSGFTVARNVTSGLRTFRLLKSGDYSAYSGKACAVVFDDSAPSPARRRRYLLNVVSCHTPRMHVALSIAGQNV